MVPQFFKKIIIKKTLIIIFAIIAIIVIGFCIYRYAVNPKTKESSIHEGFVDQELEQAFEDNTQNPINFSNKKQKDNIFYIPKPFVKYGQDILQPGDSYIKFEADPIPGWKKENSKCEYATEPKFLPKKDSQAKIGCGWWYNDDDVDDNIDSFGAIGNEKEPFGNNNADGEWFWDTNEAQKLEDIKICKRIKSCELADLIPGKCGFCPSLNSGIPINLDGKNLYPDIACLDDPITNPYKCPRPNTAIRLICDPDPNTGKLHNKCLIKIAKTLGYQESGMLIKILNGDPDGYLDSNNVNSKKLTKIKHDLSMYDSISVSDAFFGKGICTRYNVMNFYSSVKNAVRKGTSEKSRSAAAFLVKGDAYDDCNIESNVMGPFNLHCIQNEALKNRYQHDGTKFPKTDADIKMFENMSWADVQEYFITRSKELDSDDPFVVQKASLELLGIKINPSDEDFGSITGISYYIYEWFDLTNPVSNMIKSFKNSSSSSSNTKKSSSSTSQKVLLDMSMLGLESGNMCSTILPQSSNIEDMNASPFSSEMSMNENKYIYFGREIADTFPDFDSIKKKKEDKSKKIRVAQSMIRFKGQLVSNEEFDTRFWSYIDDGIRIRINNETVLDRWAPQEDPVVLESNVFTVKNNIDNFNNGNILDTASSDKSSSDKSSTDKSSSDKSSTDKSSSDKSSTDKSSTDKSSTDKSSSDKSSTDTSSSTKYNPLNADKFIIDWYNNSKKYAFYVRFWQHNEFIPIPGSLLYQSQPTKFPIARWDFYQGTIEDRCKILTAQVVGHIPITVIDFKKCALFKGPKNYIKINSGIHIDGFKSITMMVNLRGKPKHPFRFWEFCNNRPNQIVPNANSCMKDVFLRDELYGAMSQDNVDGIGFCCNDNNTGPRVWSQCNKTIANDEWSHLAWVIEDDLSGMSLYLNGEAVAKYKHPIIELRNKIYKYMFILNSNENFDKDIAVAWFRIFDYALKPIHIYLDMNNKFARESAFPTNEKSGWE